ncbi:MAG: hypothetical protein QOJ44_18 [Acidimicrobiaceae bacterium]|nr:hypothetical protein [Acidimicrobiaceae bacterium]
MTACPRSPSLSLAPNGTVRASSVLRDVTAQVRATTIRKVCAQLIKNRQPKELPHSEMSRVERGLQVMDAVRHPRWNAQSSLNCPDTALSRRSRATAGPMMRNTKPVSEASIQTVNLQHETAEGLVRDPDRLTEPVWACRNNGMSIDVSPSSSMRRAPWGKAGHLRVHGLLIGTSEPTHSRRSVADRLTLRSRVMAGCGGGDPVVVRGRESRPHGEGDQVPDSFATKEE